jgi:hypothetical protein
MKRIFSILFTLVLLLSFSLIPAASVSAIPEPAMMGWWYNPWLVGEWHFDKVFTHPSTNVQTTWDSSGKLNIGTLMPLGEEPTLVPGKLHNALSFDGVDDYVDCAAAVDDSITSGVTLEAWINPAVQQNGGIISNDITSSSKMGYDFFLWNTGTYGRLYIDFGNGSALGRTYWDIPSSGWYNQWHHVAATWDGSNIKLYVDGSQVAAVSYIGTYSDPGKNTFIGAINHLTPAYSYFDGLIDEVRIWETAHPPLHVDDDGAQYATPYTTITQALDVAIDGDTIIVHKGTYNESVTINKDNLTIYGCGSKPAITGGLKFDTDLTGLTLKDFYVTGTAVPGKNSIVRMYGAITDLTIDNCVFDGENVADRYGFTGGQLEGDVTITNSEFVDILGWAVLDSRSGSGGDGSAMGMVTFVNNNVHDCNGTVVFRGLSTDWTDNVYICKNTFENIGEAGVSEHWAAFEVNRANNVKIHDNKIHNVVENPWGEGQAMQLWKVGKVDVYRNTIENNYMGIYILKWPAAETYDISDISIHSNSFTGNNNFALSVEDGLTGGPLDATRNWWGHRMGPYHPTLNPDGEGDKVSDNVDFAYWLKRAVKLWPHWPLWPLWPKY